MLSKKKCHSIGLQVHHIIPKSIGGINDKSNYVFLTDETGNIIFSFDTKKNEENVKNELKQLAQKTIMRYDIIKKIQEDYS